MSIVIFMRDFVGAMDVRRDVDVDADVDVIELRIDQRIDADAADAGLKRSGRHRHALADLQRGLLAVNGADLRLLDDLCLAVVVQEFAVAGGIVTWKLVAFRCARVFRLMVPVGCPS